MVSMGFGELALGWWWVVPELWPLVVSRFRDFSRTRYDQVDFEVSVKDFLLQKRGPDIEKVQKEQYGPL